jgi:RNA polymerase sigma-70 factor (ECF subfamily)
MVFNTSRRLLGNPEDAADATHEVFLRAAASLHAAPDGKDARAWLTTVARNHCLDLLRRRRRFRAALTTLGASASELQSETVVVDRQLAQTVLEQLAVRERQALWQSHVEERPVGEIAERLGMSYMAAAQLLSRARRRAALVAAELAAILGLVREGLLRRRTMIQGGVQPVASVLAIPLVVTALVSTSSGTPVGYAAQPSVAAAPFQSVPRRDADHPSGSSVTNPNVGPLQSGPANATTSIAQTAGGVLHSTIGNAQQAGSPLPVAQPPSPRPACTQSLPPHAISPPGPPRKWGHLKHCNQVESVSDRSSHRPTGNRPRKHKSG